MSLQAWNKEAYQRKVENNWLFKVMAGSILMPEIQKSLVDSKRGNTSYSRWSDGLLKIYGNFHRIVFF